MLGVAGHETLPREGSPERGDRGDARGVSSLHVIDRISHEHGVAGLVPEALQRSLHRHRIRFMSLAAVAADDDVEVRAEANVVDSTLRQPARLAGDDAQGMTGGAEQIDSVDD